QRYKMMRHVFTLLTAGLSALLIVACSDGSTNAQSQDSQTTTADADASLAAGFSLERARNAMDAVAFDNPARVTPIWSDASDRFAYLYEDKVRVRATDDGSLLFELSAAQLADEISISPDDLSIEIEDGATSLTLSTADQAWSRVLEADASPVPSTPKPQAKVVREMFPMWGYDRRENLSPDGRIFASLDGPDLTIRDADSGEIRRLTNEQEPHILWFHGNDIWENSDTIWNPDGSHFIARRHDSSATPGMLSLDYLETSERLIDFRYWGRAGDPLPETTLVSVNVETGVLTQLGAPSGNDGHLFFIEWSPVGASILAIAYSRDLSEQTIFSINAETGEATTLLSRHVERGWVKWPSGPRTIQHLGEDQYLLRSDESGFFNYSILNTNGEPVRTLTNGDVDVGRVIGIDEGGGWLYYLAPASAERPYDQIPHRVDLEGGDPQQLASDTGVYSAWLSPNKTHLVWRHSDVDRATQTELATVDGDLIAVVETVETPKSILEAPLPEMAVFESFDGTKVHAQILKPAGFDPEKSYPVIHRVYGAMQSKVTRTGFWPETVGWPGSEYNSMLNYFAQQGFVVVLMDPPGTPGRGRDYNLAYWGNWPGDTADHYAAGLKALGADRPWMDLSRVAVEGNSWGGYVALFTALEKPDVYKSVSISVPEVELMDHAHWIEWQMGTPANNPEAYEAGALQNRVDELDVDLIIVAGMNDANVSVSNTMKLLDALAEQGKPYELVIFPGTNHPHQGRGDRYAYAVERIRAFLDTSLNEPEPET
ncbi:MAG: prolyl oligopeptidase family serine peptidase, partial [Pseudomonadota bacterium]